MALKRRWLQNALAQADKPQPALPWQARKLAAMVAQGTDLPPLHCRAMA